MSAQSQIIVAVVCSMALAMAGAIRLAGVRAKRAELPDLTRRERTLLLVTRGCMLILAINLLVLSRILFTGHTRICIAAILAGASISAIFDTVREFRFVRTAVTIRQRWVHVTVAVVSNLFVVSVFLFLTSIPGSNAKALKAGWPVRGELMVLAGGRTKLTNPHHDNPPAQNLAVDLGVHPDYWKGIGVPVYCPVDGIVTRAVNTELEDGSGPAEGNVVVVETSDGTIVTLAHLSTGSVSVLPGAAVRMGQEIARLGQSGSASVPHLHVHAEKSGVAVPMVFGERGDFLVKGERVGN